MKYSVLNNVNTTKEPLFNTNHLWLSVVALCNQSLMGLPVPTLARPMSQLHAVPPFRLVCDIVSHILSLCLRRVRCNPFYLALCDQDQHTLITHTWGSLFLLSAAYWPLDIAALVARVRTQEVTSYAAVTVSNPQPPSNMNELEPK